MSNMKPKSTAVKRRARRRSKSRVLCRERKVFRLKFLRQKKTKSQSQNLIPDNPLTSQFDKEANQVPRQTGF